MISDPYGRIVVHMQISFGLNEECDAVYSTLQNLVNEDGRNNGVYL